MTATTLTADGTGIVPSTTKQTNTTWPCQILHGNNEIVVNESVEATAKRLGLDLAAIRAAQAAANK